MSDSNIAAWNIKAAYNKERNMNEQQRDTYRIISKKLEEIYKIVAECEQLAQEAEIEFSIDVGYGGRNTYNGELDQWQSSSANC